ncbi:hypothetical protein Dred_0520 [Desulforamulus reducens MI-1]|uniref:Uncharacterized protein n=1 Tax=Desulforamulus reducens (strain ATCC BAA-1160 / DSM 100696 / MI-1) TaxID=349161 RepID=A4J1W2_DESRM|nr:hypothetical protein Dred_0520 [Desulforamulus reducens MI-1]
MILRLCRCFLRHTSVVTVDFSAPMGFGGEQAAKTRASVVPGAAAMPGLSRAALKIFINRMRAGLWGPVNKNFLHFPAAASTLDSPGTGSVLLQEKREVIKYVEKSAVQSRRRSFCPRPGGPAARLAV